MQLTRLLIRPHPAMAEQIAHLAVGAQVVKAFNLCADSVWRGTGTSVGLGDDGSVGLDNAEALGRNSRQEYEGQPLGVPLCGNDPTALEVVGRLVRDLGCVPVAGGRPGASRVARGNGRLRYRHLGRRQRHPIALPALDRAFGTTPHPVVSANLAVA